MLKLRTARQSPDASVDEQELSLREWGATFGEPVIPSRLIVWNPDKVMRAEAYNAAQRWCDDYAFFANAMADVRSGERAAVYETGSDAGIVGFCDYGGPARRADAYPYMAAAIFRPAAARTPRAALRADVVLGAMFGAPPPDGRKRGQRVRLQRLDDGRDEALAALCGPLPPYVWVPSWWAQAHPDTGEPPPEYGRQLPWASEHELQGALAADRSALRELGITRNPRREVRSLDGASRYDLVSDSDRVFCELKLDGGLNALDQARRYSETLHRERARGYRGHVVCGPDGRRAVRCALRPPRRTLACGYTDAARRATSNLSRL